ncbi:hypothetical protein [Paenibacillus sp. S150]|uniref:hypothetical protein n=1 Tax=Paenibacillus sp. S150 TaxID=2749826 RepID=UPI001C5615D1|nr:hypothetical protein [Paenibacillus sp. S150]MBW4083535.1 hypothetical protein [Paenibacillus sp. S150]
MKKFISGVIVGSLLFASASVFADSASLIGQKVQGLFSVEKGGVKVSDAVIINGSAYAPVRAVAEAADVNLTVKGKTIIMETKNQETASSSVTSNSEVTDPKTSLSELKSERAKVAADIERYTASIKDLKEGLIPSLEEQTKILENTGKIGEMTKENLETYKKLLSEKEAELIVLNQRLKELDAEIATLQ